MYIKIVLATVYKSKKRLMVQVNVGSEMMLIRLQERGIAETLSSIVNIKWTINTDIHTYIYYTF